MEWTPLIITVAPNGARKTHQDHPALPMTADEIARDAVACRDAGAAMLHLHVRDQDGAHTLDIDLYRDAMVAVRDAVGDELIIQVTTEAVGHYTPDEQIALVRKLHPEAASVALKELTADGDAKAAAFYLWAHDEGIALQHILYTPEEVARLADLVHQDLVPCDNLSVLYVLGRYGDGESQPGDLLPFLSAARDHNLHPKLWSVCAFGAGEGAVALAALSLGGHVRVGFENNLYLNTKMIAPDNAALVGQVADGAHLIARPLCQAAEARALMGAMGPGGEGERDSRDQAAKENGTRLHLVTQSRDLAPNQLNLMTSHDNIGR